ncbi:MAG: hypothetical protein IJ666_02515 [Ruminococcus sp.]|nr:hypothetical protein [Ruminococcus sp.]
MAVRPAYFIENNKAVRRDFEFQWFPGFALSQKQKSICALHSAVKSADVNAAPLEISTKGTDPLGVKMSAFNLKLGGYTLENIFQSSKIFENGGAYRDLLTVSPKDAKRDERLKSSGRLIRFNYDNCDFPIEPKTVFYDYIYIMAAAESLTADKIQLIKNYNYFTDIEFNPQKSINTQAKSAAIIRLMLNIYSELPQLNAEEFIKFHRAFVNA